LAGSVVRVFDLLMESRLAIVAETILPIEMQLIAAPVLRSRIFVPFFIAFMSAPIPSA